MQDIIGQSYFYATPEAVARSYRAQRQTARSARLDALPPVARNSNPALVAELRRMPALAESGQIVSVFGGATTPSGDVVPIVVNRPASRPKLRLIRRP